MSKLDDEMKVLAGHIWSASDGEPRILVHPDVYDYLRGECEIEDVPERYRDQALALELAGYHTRPKKVPAP